MLRVKDNTKKPELPRMPLLDAEYGAVGYNLENEAVIRVYNGAIVITCYGELYVMNADGGGDTFTKEYEFTPRRDIPVNITIGKE